MTTEIELAANGRDAIMPAVPGTTAAALDMLRGHAEMMAAAHQLASAMVGTQMVPAVYQRKGKDDTVAAENATAAILYGAELGLNPIQSLQQVFPVHGQPSIYARTMVALLKARGYRFRTVESTDESVSVEGTSPSRETETSTWTIERARLAGYTSNKKYQTDPQAMLYAKACAEVCRKLAPDVLLGISHTREDLELEPAQPIRVTSERVTPADITPTGTPATGPVVQQWQAPAETELGTPTSDEGEKSDIAAEFADEQQAAETSPAEPPSTRIQQKKIARLFNEQGVEDDADKLLAIGKFLERDITSADDILRGEAIRLLDYLERDPAIEDQAATATEGSDQ